MAMHARRPADARSGRACSSGYGQMLMLLDRFASRASCASEAIAIARRSAPARPRATREHPRPRPRRPGAAATSGIALARGGARHRPRGRQRRRHRPGYVNLSEALMYCGRPAEARVEAVRRGDARRPTRSGSRGRTARSSGHNGVADRLRARRVGRGRPSWRRRARHRQSGRARDRYGLAAGCRCSSASGDSSAPARARRLRSCSRARPVEGQFSGDYHAAPAELALWGATRRRRCDGDDGPGGARRREWPWYLLRLYRLGACAPRRTWRRSPAPGATRPRSGGDRRPASDAVGGAAADRRAALGAHGRARQPRSAAERATPTPSGAPALDGPADAGAWRAPRALGGAARPYLAAYCALARGGGAPRRRRPGRAPRRRCGDADRDRARPRCRPLRGGDRVARRRGPHRPRRHDADADADRRAAGPAIRSG